MNRKLYYVLCFICIAVIFLSNCSLDRTKPVETVDISKVEMVDTLFSNQQFMFRGIEWSSSEQQVLKKEKIEKKKAVISNNGTRIKLTAIKSPNKTLFKELDLTVDTVYQFTDNMFVRGEYASIFDDISKFTLTAQNVIDAVAEKFGNPSQGNIEGFTEIPKVEEGGKEVMWDAKDGSQLSVGIFNNTGITNPPYILVISVRTPN